MKKNTKIALIILAAAVILVLIIVNMNSVKEQERLANYKQLEIVAGGTSKIYNYDEQSSLFVDFSAKMKRKNGEVTDKEYSGIQLKDIFKQMGISLSDTTKITVVCADRYEISLNSKEINSDGNIYIVTKESGKALSEENGAFMMVVIQDEFSTRWAKNIVQVKVSEK